MTADVALDLRRGYSFGVTPDDRGASHITNQDTRSMDIKTERSDGTLIAKAEGTY